MLYDHVNGTVSDDIQIWGDFVHLLDDGLKAITTSQVPDKALYRVAWIPDEVLAAHYKEGAEVVFRAPISSATSIKWEFYEAAVGTPDVAGKTCVILQFDESASRHAAQISAYSAVVDEDERLFAPFFRAMVHKSIDATDANAPHVHDDPAKPALRCERASERLFSCSSPIIGCKACRSPPPATPSAPYARVQVHPAQGA